MLSISNVANSSAAGAYYEQADDYYSRDRSPSLWSGRGAAQLGLSGEVQGEDFRALLDGRLPNGEHIHNAAAGRRGGTDLTFSAPKSLSMQALISGDTRLMLAHETAVTRALAYAETLTACRVTDKGTTARQITGNMVVAQFRHDLSRATDPQLHTHCVVLNMTKRSDGQWRAVDNEPLYRHKMFLGAHYRSELAKEVQVLGYEVRITHSDGRFELAHIEPAQVKAFSTRSGQIEEKLKALGKTREQVSAKLLQTLALQTRQAKGEIDRDSLKLNWLKRAQSAGINFEVGTPAEPLLKMDCAKAAQSIAHAAEHLGERDAVFHRIDLVRAALEVGTGRTDLQQIESELDKAVKEGEVIRSGERFTTPAAQHRERDILALEKQGRDQLFVRMPDTAIDQALKAKSLNGQQKDVVRHVLSARHRVIGVQGSAGTGKTTALRAVRELAEKQGFKPLGLAPSAGAAMELASTGIASQTLASIAARNYAGLTEKSLVVVDEAGMVSSRDMHALLVAADKAQARVVLVGDIRQLKAVQAGRPFDQLQAAGMATVQLTEIQRQRDPMLKEAVQLAAGGDVAASLEKLQAIESSVVELEIHTDRHVRMATDYTALSKAERAGTMMVAGTNHHREAINSQVREHLGLTGKGIVISTLSRKDISEIQALRTVSYQAGDVVRAERDYTTLKMRKGELAQVVDGRAGVVTLQRMGTQGLGIDDAAPLVEWRPAQHTHFTAYHLNEREMAVGDVVSVTRNNYALGLLNGDRVTIVSIPDYGRKLPDSTELVIEKSDGVRICLLTSSDGSQPLYLEHGYCQTVHAAQGKTCERILIEAPTLGSTGNEASYYVAISRATHKAVIYTDDAQRLAEAFGRPNEKSAALDLLGEEVAIRERTDTSLEME